MRITRVFAGPEAPMAFGALMVVVAIIGIADHDYAQALAATLSVAICAVVVMRRVPMRITHRGPMRHGHWHSQCKICGGLGIDTHVSGPLRSTTAIIATHIRDDH